MLSKKENEMIASIKKSDTLGIVVSGLCLVHCLAVPVLFILGSTMFLSEDDVPAWWKSLDYIFLVLSFLAVLRSSKTTSKPSVKWLLWISWTFLAFVLLNEKMELLPLPEATIFIPTISLIVLHEYNRRYCVCKEDSCCAA